MDCFSAGCVIAELFLEGTPLFKLSQLFQYREGEFNVDHSLNAIEDEGVRVSTEDYGLFPFTTDRFCRI
jgi:phosphoinositide-3-kinase regulatory subunit 4